MFILIVFINFLKNFDKILCYRQDWPPTCCNLPTSASRILRQACSTKPSDMYFETAFIPCFLYAVYNQVEESQTEDWGDPSNCLGRQVYAIRISGAPPPILPPALGHHLAPVLLVTLRSASLRCPQQLPSLSSLGFPHQCGISAQTDPHPWRDLFPSY